MSTDRNKDKAYTDYDKIPSDFYEESIDKANPLTKYYHKKRFEKVRKFLAERFKTGMRIIDIGCGSVRWNNLHLPVVGVDINENMLNHAIKKNRIQKKILWNINNGQMDIGARTFDFVILSEVLEHMEEPLKLLKEANRLTRKDGFLVLTVPLDNGISVWRILFEIGCLIRGDILGDEYFKGRCGHIQHFSFEDLALLLEKAGYLVVEKDITLLNIGLVAQKIQFPSIK